MASKNCAQGEKLFYRILGKVYIFPCEKSRKGDYEKKDIRQASPVEAREKRHYSPNDLGSRRVGKIYIAKEFARKAFKKK